MSKYIPVEKLIAEIERRKKELLEQAVEFGTFESNRVGLYDNVELYDDLLSLITSLQQEQPDYKEAVQLVFEEKLIPFKDGNQWCFLLGHNIQDGICGFGDTILDAAVDFYKDYMNTKIHIGELKISMAKQKQPEVELEKEIDKKWKDCDPIDEGMGYESALLISEQFHQIARHFYELGLNIRKED